MNGVRDKPGTFGITRPYLPPDPMTPGVERLTNEAIASWQRGATCLPQLGRRFTPAQQCQKEALLDEVLDLYLNSLEDIIVKPAFENATIRLIESLEYWPAIGKRYYKPISLMDVRLEDLRWRSIRTIRMRVKKSPPTFQRGSM